jgi:hypothetical protein
MGTILMPMLLMRTSLQLVIVRVQCSCRQTSWKRMGSKEPIDSSSILPLQMPYMIMGHFSQKISRSMQRDHWLVIPISRGTGTGFPFKLVDYLIPIVEDGSSKSCTHEIICDECLKFNFLFRILINPHLKKNCERSSTFLMCFILSNYSLDCTIVDINWTLSSIKIVITIPLNLPIDHHLCWLIDSLRYGGIGKLELQTKPIILNIHLMVQWRKVRFTTWTFSCGCKHLMKQDVSLIIGIHFEVFRINCLMSSAVCWSHVAEIRHIVVHPLSA